MCYKQKCKVVSLNLAHPVYLKQLHANHNDIFLTTVSDVH